MMILFHFKFCNKKLIKLETVFYSQIGKHTPSLFSLKAEEIQRVIFILKTLCSKSIK